jgi:hypothetical protein
MVISRRPIMLEELVVVMDATGAKNHCKEQRMWICRLKSVLQQESVWDPKEYADSFDF